MIACEKLLQTQKVDIQQFKLKNLVVCENHKYKNNSYYLNNILFYNRIEEFEKLAESNFMTELEKVK